MEERESFREFSQKISKGRKGIKGKVTGSWGCYDAYKLMRKNHWYNIGRPVTEKEFYAIIRGVCKLLAEELAMGHNVKFPMKMGELELRKWESGAFIRDGKLKITYPVDWVETKKLWYEDSEAMNSKTLVRYENKWVYRVKYNNFRATYENKAFYQFALNTFIKKALAQNIKQGKIDTLW